MQCSLVVAESAVDVGPEWRVFDEEKRVRAASLKLVIKTDMAVMPEHGVPQSVMKEAEALVKRYFEVVRGFSPETVAVAVLWTAAKAAGVPRPLEDLLRCSKADERRVRRAAWRLKEAVRQSRRPSIEDYVKTLAARVGLPASVVKRALDILERNRRVLAGKNPWVSAAAALWLASFKKLGLLKALAEAAGTTTASIRNAAKRMRV